MTEQYDAFYTKEYLDSECKACFIGGFFVGVFSFAGALALLYASGLM